MKEHRQSTHQQYYKNQLSKPKMCLEHACFISFSRGSGKDSEFAAYFFEEFTAHLAGLNKKLSVFKYDCCEDRRKGDDWSLWIRRELCSSAMMIAICAPNYFDGSPGCVSEFKGMELLIKKRNDILKSKTQDWLIGLRLKDKFAMPALNPYDVKDFLDCFSTPRKVRQVEKYRRVVEDLADRVYMHWLWLQEDGRAAALNNAGICTEFELPPASPIVGAQFPFYGGVA
jgi:hypothetical protein